MAFLNPVDIQTDIDIGDISLFLASDDIERQSVFGNPYFVPSLPDDIEIVNHVLKFAYTSNSYDPNVNSIANYLLSLCGKYIPAAQRLLGNKTGIVVSTGGGNVNQLTTIVNIPQIIVGKTGSLIQDGATEFTILNPNAAFQGLVQAWAWIEGLLTDDADALITNQETILPEWLPNIGYKFTLQNGATFKTGQVVKGQYPVVVNLTTGTSGGGSAQDLNFYCTLNGNETKDFLNTSGQIFLVATNTSSVITIVIWANADTGERYRQIYKGSVTNEGNVVVLPAADENYVSGGNPFDPTNTNPFIFFEDIIIGADNSFIGIRITATGIINKIISCRAKFTIDTDNI